MDGPSLTKGFEGFCPVAKPDAKGKWVIGRGRDIPVPADPKKPPTCTLAEADAWFDGEDYPKAAAAAARDVGEAWAELDPVRQAALTDMAFEMGAAGLAGFRQFLMFVRAGYWISAQKAGLDSEYAREVSTRANEVMYMIATGRWPA